MVSCLNNVFIHPFFNFTSFHFHPSSSSPFKNMLSLIISKLRRAAMQRLLIFWLCQLPTKEDELAILSLFLLLNVVNCRAVTWNCFQILIGYNRGLIVLWDYARNEADQVYNASQVYKSYHSVFLGSACFCLGITCFYYWQIGFYSLMNLQL